MPKQITKTLKVHISRKQHSHCETLKIKTIELFHLGHQYFEVSVVTSMLVPFRNSADSKTTH